MVVERGADGGLRMHLFCNRRKVSKFFSIRRQMPYDLHDDQDMQVYGLDSPICKSMVHGAPGRPSHVSTASTCVHV